MFTYFQGVVVFGVGPFGPSMTTPPPKMFATKETADKLAGMLNLKVAEEPKRLGFNPTAPLYKLNTTGSEDEAGITAGLAAEEFDRWGDSAESRAYYNLECHAAQARGDWLAVQNFPSYGEWVKLKRETV